MKRKYSHLFSIALAAVLTLGSCASQTNEITPETRPSSETRESSSPTEDTSTTTSGTTPASSTGSASDTTSGTTTASSTGSASDTTSGTTAAPSTGSASDTTSGTTAASSAGSASSTTSGTTAASSAGSASSTTRKEASAAAPAETVGTIRNDLTFEYVEEPAASPEADESFSDSIAAGSVFDSDSVGGAFLPSSPSGRTEDAAADSIAGDDFDADDDFYADDGFYADAPSESTDVYDGDYDYDYTYTEYIKPQPRPRAGLLTGGEWRDSENFDFWKNLIGQRSEWSELARRWRLCTVNRIAVQVTANRSPAENVTVKLLAGETPLWEAVTDNRGNAYLFKTLDENSQSRPTKIVAERGGKQLAFAEYREGESCTLTISEEIPHPKGLDLMFVIDTTGSMGDELIYLQAELEGVIDRITKEKQISARLGLNFYRDDGDEYVVRGCDFSDNIRRAVSILNEQSASGGGDYPEAVERALSCAVYEQSWSEDSVKLLFLVLDAPPHYTEEKVEMLRAILADAARKGIRIIPVASSGVDTETEFLCRSFSLATGGTYTFLTDHSGVGGSHLEPTIGSYQVEKLNDLLARIIEDYLSR